MESEDEYQSEVESTTTDETMLYEEDEEPEFTPEPTIIEAGDGVEDAFRIISYTLDEYNLPDTTGYVEVFHAQKFKQWWTEKMKSVVLCYANQYKPKRLESMKVYEWVYRLQCSSERDPGRWQLVILAKEKEQDTMWQDERQVAEIKVQLDWREEYERRMLVFIYLKSDSQSSIYQHHVGQTNLTKEEYREVEKTTKEEMIPNPNEKENSEWVKIGRQN